MSESFENKGKILIYQTEKGDTKIDVFFGEDTIWMTQRSIAELYQTSPQNITLHIKNIYEDGELNENPTCKYYLQVQGEGNRTIKREMKFYYPLDNPLVYLYCYSLYYKIFYMACCHYC